MNFKSKLSSTISMPFGKGLRFRCNLSCSQRKYLMHYSMHQFEYLITYTIYYMPESIPILKSSQSSLPLEALIFFNFHFSGFFFLLNICLFTYKGLKFKLTLSSYYQILNSSFSNKQLCSTIIPQASWAQTWLPYFVI